MTINETDRSLSSYNLQPCPKESKLKKKNKIDISSDEHFKHFVFIYFRNGSNSVFFKLDLQHDDVPMQKLNLKLW